MNIATQTKPVEKVHIEPQKSPILGKTTFEKKWLKIRFFFHMAWIAIKKYKSPVKIFRLIKGVLSEFNKINDVPLFTKVARVGDRYFWRLGLPGFPSKAMDDSIADELHRVEPFKAHNGLRTVLIGITKKCPLSCEHCFEWPNLNQKETLTTDNLIHLVKEYQDFEATQIWFGGGEPMVRIKDIYTVLEHIKPGSDFWIYTSGFNFTSEHAHKLKTAGLTGIVVSIDHHEQEQHDRFRGFPGAYKAATTACIAAKEANLAVSLSVCVTPEYGTKENLEAYLEMARKLGVCFVQFIEARSAGRYQHKQVSLSQDQLKMIQEIYQRYNTAPEYNDFPIIGLPDQQRRNIGCQAGGKRFFYIDTDGDAHACPFCTKKVCSTLTNKPAEVIAQMQKNGCHVLSFGDS